MVEGVPVVPSGQQMKGHQPQRPDVSFWTDSAPTRGLLRRHVGRRATYPRQLGTLTFCQHLCQAEVKNLDDDSSFGFLGEEDVCWLEVTMHHATAVGMTKATLQLCEDG